MKEKVPEKPKSAFQRFVVELYNRNGQKVKEIAKDLHVHKATVETWIGQLGEYVSIEKGCVVINNEYDSETWIEIFGNEGIESSVIHKLDREIIAARAGKRSKECSNSMSTLSSITTDYTFERQIDENGLISGNKM